MALLSPTAPTDTNPWMVDDTKPPAKPAVPTTPTDPTGTIPAVPPVTLAPSTPTDPTGSIPAISPVSPEQSVPSVTLAPSAPTDQTPSTIAGGAGYTPSPSILAQVQSGGVSDGTPLPTPPGSPITLAQPSSSGPPVPVVAPTIAAPSSPVDRVKLAQEAFDTFAKSSDPYYQKTLRDATSSAAAGGRLGSGMLRTSLGDAASNRQLQLDAERDRLINAATEGSITDANTAFQQQLASTGQAQAYGSDQQRIQLAKDQLAQTGAQFGLSLAQQKDLATLADKTANRQLDITTAYGQNSLLLELAKIMGGTTGNVDPNFIASVAKALGLANLPVPVTPTTATPTPIGQVPLAKGGGGIGLASDPYSKGGVVGGQQGYFGSA